MATQRREGPDGAVRPGAPVEAGPSVFKPEPPSRMPGPSTPLALPGLVLLSICLRPCTFTPEAVPLTRDIVHVPS